ncbi:UDP-N-acetylglucosamine 2-epimerase [Delftia tsuruhatensis]|uniref:non-hydrolyzing UDP-N-acetylglucosamine 2-epimerase n=1 Tax=Delftia tsuruhatensis TaxID=180282 RepID=UPI001E6B6DA1|nr:UDP-N-acetylglucosamine 2-epimerase (non-hydrolyzing) [Delftia tsuruhatensis]CAB5711483.1 UDP-N-acetylglucosamine 2-epimerase [Delftia tsuruhatensis]CAC9686810.1 UDP-N-acetylglucosamine 2-epimerase [Delftia tsuruhatensis]
MKIVSFFGTRPEAIKMAPLVTALAGTPGVESVVCVTGQHRQMLDQVMDLFGLKPQHDLAVMQPSQTLNGLFSRVVAGADAVLEQERPDQVLVHGDTSTATACALAAFHRRIPVGHVEAGLRTGDLAQPFPEEMNRRVVDVVSQWMFAPTPTSRANLLRENLQGRIAVTGNTVIDALATLCRRLETEPALASAIAARYPWVQPQRPMLLVTGHRRENFGEGFQNICAALADLARCHPELLIVYPVHFNPAVREVVMRTLGGMDNIRLIDPLDYVDFVWFMQHAHIILTDSGGVQEEAPYLGKPVLVMRDVTERPEAVSAGTVLLVGTQRQRIFAEVDRLLGDAAYHASFARRVNPYGDGHASRRIVQALLGRPFDEFAAGHTGAMAAMVQGMAPA